MEDLKAVIKGDVLVPGDPLYLFTFCISYYYLVDCRPSSRLTLPHSVNQPVLGIGWFEYITGGDSKKLLSGTL